MIYLHIGTEKTGSTSIQKFLWKNRQKLAFNNIYVPDFLSNNHVDLVLYAALRNSCRGLLIKKNLYEETLYNRFISTFPKVFVSRLQPLVDDGLNLVLTSELLSTRLVKIEQINKLAELLQQLKQPIKVIIYLRRQDEYIASSYSTSILNGHTFDLDSYIEKPNMNLNYYEFVNQWAQVFGKENIIVRAFQLSKLLNQNVVADFLQIIGLKEKMNLNPQENDYFLNPALDYSTIEFLRLLNHHFPEYINNQYNFRRKNIVHSLQEISGNSKIKLPTIKAIEILKKYKNSNDQVSIEYLNNHSDSLFIEDDLSNPNYIEEQPILDSAKAVKIAFDLINKLKTAKLESYSLTQQEATIE